MNEGKLKPGVKTKLYNFSLAMAEQIAAKKTFIYIDESSFNRNMTSLYGYSPKNTPVRVVSWTKGPSLSLIAAISKKAGLEGFQVF